MEWMPEKPERVPSVILGKVNPGVGKLVGDVTLMKCPHMPGYLSAPPAKISSHPAINSGFLEQFSYSSVFTRLTWLHTSLDQLQARQRMRERQNLQRFTAAQYHRASFIHCHVVLPLAHCC